MGWWIMGTKHLENKEEDKVSVEEVLGTEDDYDEDYLNKVQG